MATQLDAGFRIADWEVRPQLGTITGPRGSIRLEPKVMRVLVCLAAAAGEVVTRDEFIARVWDGRVVTDEVLSRCISMLRTSLADDPRQPRYIQTIPKIGYRLLAPVAPLPPASPPVPETAGEAATGTRAPAVADALGTPRRRRGVRAVLAVAALAAVGLAALAAWLLSREPPTGEPVARGPAIVVLPFADHSPAGDAEYFSDGLTEELIDRLAEVPGLEVVASTSSFAFKDQPRDVRSIAAQLDVEFVLEGNVRRDGDRVRIAAQLIDAARGVHLWSKRYDSTLAGIFDVQDAIAGDIVAELGPRLAGAAPAPPPAHRTAVLPAYELLLRGRYHLRRREESSIRRSIELLREAVDLDPAYTDAWRELARAYVLLPSYSYEDPDEMYAEAVATIDRGAAIQPALRDEAADVLGLVHFNRWEWNEAEAAFRRALATSAHDPSTRQWYSQLLANVGRLDDSLAHILEAKRLDVLSPVVNHRLAVAWLWMDDDRNARRQFDLADELGMGPSPNPEVYVVLLLREGNYAEARQGLVDLQKLFARASEWIDPFLAAVADPAQRPAARAALARAAREHQISAGLLFGAWVYLGDNDAAMDVAFDLLYEPGEFPVEFLFARETAALRCHPRFPELVRTIGLERYWQEYGWPSAYVRPGEVRGCE